jgi:hypothetical protein
MMGMAHLSGFITVRLKNQFKALSVDWQRARGVPDAGPRCRFSHSMTCTKPNSWLYPQIANEHGAYLMMDMAHISGLIAGQEQQDPFQYCDVVTTTTHKVWLKIAGCLACILSSRHFFSQWH